jgi:hypothetical protein
VFIAFEGPDNTGKSTSAAHLTHNGQAIYNATKENYQQARIDLAEEPDLVQCFDRIDWLSHMVYRLALPEHEWNDDRVRTVFAMPDTHLVFRVHGDAYVNDIDDELYDTGTVALVNPVYRLQAEHLVRLNRHQSYRLFKSISVVEVQYDPFTGSFHQRLLSHDSAAFGWYTEHDEIDSDSALLGLFQSVEQYTV